MSKIVEGQRHEVVAAGYSLVQTKEHGMIKTTKDGNTPQPYHAAVEPGRNDMCPCGSGKKYKKCCLGKTAAVEPPKKKRGRPAKNK